MSESVHTISAVLLNPENVGVAFGISSLSSIEAEILRYFLCTSSIGGIFDLLVTRMSESVPTSPAALLDPENVAFGISSLSSIETEILRYFICTSGYGGHL